MMWAKHPFLDNLYEEAISKHPTVYDEGWKRQMTAMFEEKLGEFPSSAPLAPSMIHMEQKEGYVRCSIEITTLPQLKMAMYLLVPDAEPGEKLPAVLALHGHGPGNRGAAGMNPDGKDHDGEADYHKDFAIELTKRGMIVAVPELIGFGERRYAPDDLPENPNDNSCYSLASQLLLLGKTLAGLRIFECRRVIDYLAGRSDVDEERIGIIGISGGGLVAAYTSVLDERIRTAVISGYTNTFRGSIMDRRHCLDNYIPGILELGEMPDLIGLLAPRPLFVEAGKQDHLFPEKHTAAAFEKIEKIYEEFSAKGQAKLHFFEGGHEISGEKSFDWLKSQLSAAPAHSEGKQG